MKVPQISVKTENVSRHRTASKKAAPAEGGSAGDFLWYTVLFCIQVSFVEKHFISDIRFYNYIIPDIKCKIKDKKGKIVCAYYLGGFWKMRTMYGKKYNNKMDNPGTICYNQLCMKT